MKHRILFSLLLAFWVFSGCSLLVEVKDPPDPSCGDGRISGDEGCDGNNLGPWSCGSLGYGEGTLACRPDCNFDISGCEITSSCGDGQVDAEEQCDGLNLKNKTCMDLAFESGTLSCFGVDHGDSACTFNTSGCVGGNPCGNGSIDTGEDCDVDNLNGKTCNDLGYPDGQLSCRTDCRFDTNNCYSDEICNDGADNDVDGLTDCEDPDCQSFCPGYCGDGIIQDGDGEDCDLTNLNNTSCADWGFDSGSLSCDGNCRLDFSQCSFIMDISNPTLVSSGQAHTCTINGSMMVYCWGWDQHGQLGIQSGQMYQPVPVPLSFTGTWMLATHLSAGGMHTCAVSGNVGFMGIVLCWGNNTMGQIGNGSTATIEPLPVPILNITNITKVAAGFEHTCALNINSSVYCWGSNTHGQLGLGSGYGTSVNQPTHVTSLTNIIAISAGFNHTCAIQQIDAVTNALWCWGDNSANQLGIGDYAGPTDVPVLVGTFNPRDVSCGQAHTCALNNADIVHCWGDNTYGQLGRSGSGSNIPIVVMKAGSAFSASLFTAGANHTCATATGPMGDTYCWGKNDHGQLGLGHTNQMNTPTMVTGLLSTTQLSGGGDHTCMIGQRAPEQNCSDAFDNDGDGFTDCDDSDCFNMTNCIGIENTGAICSNGVDDDGDGKTDCNDPDCFTQTNCMTSEDCSDGFDNDFDGLVDCADPICYNSPMCMMIPTRLNCWGGNWYGQLGNATTADQYYPALVMGQ